MWEGGGGVQMQVCEVFDYFISIFSINFKVLESCVLYVILLIREKKKVFVWRKPEFHLRVLIKAYLIDFY